VYSKTGVVSTGFGCGFRTTRVSFFSKYFSIFDFYLNCVSCNSVNGYLSLLVPSNDNGRSDWRLSPTMTASRILQILSLSKSALGMSGLLKSLGSHNHSIMFGSVGVEKDVIKIITFYGSLLSSNVGGNYAYPSISFLAKYWQDQINDVQQAARTILASTLKVLPASEKTAIVNYWRPHRNFFFFSLSLCASMFILVPATIGANSKKATKAHFRAAIVLGIIGAEDPILLSEK
jgi:hypothetical protein